MNLAPRKTLQDMDVAGKRVLVRVDFNVPLGKDNEVKDSTRIKATKPTLDYLIKHKAKLILMAHLKRPGGKVVEELRLDKVAKAAEKVLGHKIKKFDVCIGKEVSDYVHKKMKPGEIVLLENTRFYPEEKSGDMNYAKQLAALAEVYINDAFAASHRSHASVVGVAKFLPSAAGMLLQQEIEALTKITEGEIEHPFVAIIGGAKIETKIHIFKNLFKRADSFMVGGALANTFLYAQGIDVGESAVEEEKMEEAQLIMLEAEKYQEKMILPVDAVVADELKFGAATVDVQIEDIIGDMKIFDIGRHTIARFKALIKHAKTVVWNGPMGVYEIPEFAKGSKEIAEAIAEADAYTVIGGGETLDILTQFKIDRKKFDHVSTGGGAMIEFLSGKALPGIACLDKKE